MVFDYSRRVKIAVVLLVLVALHGSGMIALGTGRKKAQTPTPVDGITWYERRFVELRKELPPGGVVGYVTDQSPQPGSDFLLTQYALAPVIVKRTTKQDLVVGNFHDPRKMAETVRNENLVLIRDFGQGIVLFRGNAK